MADVKVTETFIAVHVTNMTRATAFYTSVFGATVSFASPAWTSTHIAGVRIGLALGAPGRNGLHLAVTDLAAACAAVERAGGRITIGPTEVAPGVIVADVVDCEGNSITLRGP
jgi:predicted enzyme related to lactoylglutathione lyase